LITEENTARKRFTKTKRTWIR